MFNKNFVLFHKLNPKLLIAVGVIIFISGLIQLFIFSTHEENDESYQQSFSQSYKIFALNIPKDLNFSGEKVPVENFYVRENLDRELLVNTYFQSQTLLYIKRANRWFPVIEPILKREGVPDDFKFLALIESGFSNVISPRGAAGFWQIMKDAGEQYGLEINEEVDERFSIEKSTEVACRYLKDAYKLFNNWTLAAASYNMGMEGISRQVEKQKTVNYYDLNLNDETSRYIFRILVVKEIMQNPKRYGFLVRKKDLYPQIATSFVSVDSAIISLPDFATQHGINYKILKILNPWLKETFLSNKKNNTYQIAIPKEESIKFLLSFDSEGEENGSPFSYGNDSVLSHNFNDSVSASNPDTLSPAEKRD